MFHRLVRLGAFATALALTLTACSAGAKGLDSSVPVKSAADISSSVQNLEVIPVLAPAPEPEPKPQPVLTQADIDEALAQVMERYSAAGVTVATVECGQLSQAGAWGWAVKNERKMTPDTKIRIASISKVVIAMCAMAMAEDGTLDLDAPISNYWGAGAVNPYSKTQPTARTFLTHTSSIKNLETTRGLSKLKGILHQKSSWRTMEPGNGGYWAYSNFGMCILGTTLELASNQPLDDYLQVRFLEPLGAKASFYGGRLNVDEVATIYSGGSVGRSAQKQTGQPVPTEIGQGASYFPGGYTTSAVDMAKLIAVLANDGVYKETRLLSEASVADMETPRFKVDLADYASFEQCLILRRQENVMGQNVLYYHTGSAYGVFSLMTYNPETKNGIVVITTGARRNMNEHGMYALCADLMEILYAKMEAQSL